MSAAKDQNSPTLFSGKVSAEWLSRGIWLSQAWKTIPNDYLEAAREAAAEFATLHGCDSMHSEYAEAQTGDGFGEYRAHKSQLIGEDRIAWTKYANRRAMAEMAVLNSLVGYNHGGMYPLVAFGSPDRAGAEFEWISPLAWKQMKPVAGKKDIVSGGGNIYYDVHVVDFNRWPVDDIQTPVVPAAETQKGLTQQRPTAPFDFDKAKWLLKTMKSTKEITGRPTRSVVQGILEAHYTNVSRDKADKILMEVWGRGRAPRGA